MYPLYFRTKRLANPMLFTSCSILYEKNIIHNKTMFSSYLYTIKRQFQVLFFKKNLQIKKLFVTLQRKVLLMAI